jgi:hypothetical protein
MKTTYFVVALLAATAARATPIILNLQDIDKGESTIIANGSSRLGTFNIVSGDGDTNINISSPYTSWIGSYSDVAGYNLAPLVGSSYQISNSGPVFLSQVGNLITYKTTIVNGVDTTTDTLSSAAAHFFFRDDSDTATESVRINLDASAFVSSSFILNQSFSVFGGALSGSILGSLSSTGVLSWDVRRDPTGSPPADFFFDYALLTASISRDTTTATSEQIIYTYETVQNNVPDSGTTGLLVGLGLLGLLAARRKR